MHIVFYLKKDAEIAETNCNQPLCNKNNILCPLVHILTVFLHLNFPFDSFTLFTVSGLDLIVW